MSDINIFERHELKYMLDAGQKKRLLLAMEPYMERDMYARTTVRSVYFDTEDYRIIRHSLEKPVYKEKLRLRSYGRASQNSKVFVELKKKYKSVVYKRRISMGNEDAIAWLTGEPVSGGFVYVPSRGGLPPFAGKGPAPGGGELCPGGRGAGEKSREPFFDAQIAREVEYFRNCYKGLAPRVFLSCEREAYRVRGGGDFRITLDENILARNDRLSLDEDVGGVRILGAGLTLAELKISSAMPVWMAGFLNEEKLYKTSFSKYGEFYEKVIFPERFARGARADEPCGAPGERAPGEKAPGEALSDAASDRKLVKGGRVYA